MSDTVMTGMNDKQPHRSEVHRRQRKKNLALMALLFAWAVVFYFVAIFRMGGATMGGAS